MKIGIRTSNPTFFNTRFNQLTGLYKSTVPIGRSGDWVVEQHVVSNAEATLGMLRALINQGRGRFVPEGTYTGLKRGNCLVMSDTPDEIKDNADIVYEAHRHGGHILIAGLGLGVTVELVLESSNVDHVTVVESSPDVIALVAPHLQSRHDGRLTVVQADIFSWRPPRGQRYSAAWFDIWNTICADNLPEMRVLKRKFSRRTDWCGCWQEEE